MRKSTKAVLFSVLVFPGTGHYMLRRWIRGFLFMLPTLLAFGYYIGYEVDRAMVAVDQILSGELSPDAASIEQMLSEEPPVDKALLLSIAKWLIPICWIVAAVDAYFLGRAASVGEGDESMNRSP